ncbi:MAG: HD domain-containing phosphohydrolase [Chloroflexota bacterium]
MTKPRNNPSPETPSTQWNILVVEDSPEMLDILVCTLEIHKHIVYQAKNGKTALEVLEKTTPDLILSDINMPVMDGISFYKELRKIPHLTKVPFIFLTSDSAPEDIQRGRELGVEDYLTKPIDPMDLLQIVNARLLRSADIQLALVNQAYLETVTVLANSIEGRDAYTHGHVERVTTYATLLAEALRWPADQLRLLRFGSILHDLGKIIIPDRVLNKPGKLTDEEWRLMRQHSSAGAKILREISHLQNVIPYVLYHHERWDGSGYPESLKGKEIPIQGRVLALADVYDALTTTRPYHPARPHNEVVQFMRYQAGKHFDPGLVPVFIQVVSNYLARKST